MKLSEVYAHKAEYQELYDAIREKSEILPTLRATENELEHMLERCRFYDKWRIDLPYYDDGLSEGCTIYPGLLYIKNANVRFNEPTDLLVLWHSTGPYIFSFDHDTSGNGDYPKAFFDKFWQEVSDACPPDYVDSLNAMYYYRPENAAWAYESHNAILAKYRSLNAEDIKQRKIAKLEAELGRLKVGGASK